MKVSPSKQAWYSTGMVAGFVGEEQRDCLTVAQVSGVGQPHSRKIPRSLGKTPNSKILRVWW